MAAIYAKAATIISASFKTIPPVHSQFTTTAAIFPPSSIKQFQNINLAPAKIGGSVFRCNCRPNRPSSTGGHGADGSRNEGGAQG